MITRGFSLIEILIVLTIVAILASIGLPIYSQYMVKAKRLAAATTLQKLATAMEQYQIENETYLGATIKLLNVSTVNLKIDYAFSIQFASNADYLLSAKPIGSQAMLDIACGTLTLAANGERGKTGRGKLEECW